MFVGRYCEFSRGFDADPQDNSTDSGGGITGRLITQIRNRFAFMAHTNRRARAYPTRALNGIFCDERKGSHANLPCEPAHGAATVNLLVSLYTN